MNKELTVYTFSTMNIFFKTVFVRGLNLHEISINYRKKNNMNRSVMCIRVYCFNGSDKTQSASPMANEMYIIALLTRTFHYTR